MPEASAAADLAACRALLAGGSKSFLAASYALPRAVRDPATALYAFCRVADDLIDGIGPRADGASLAVLGRRLDAVYADGAAIDERLDAVDRAFARVIAAHRLPRALPAALLEGFAWDACGRRYETLGELHGYAARVAGSVGAMMALVMGTRSATALARACDLGVAMQLSNIARDVGEDARAGRLYLPLAWLRDAGIDGDAFLAAPRFDARLAGVVARLLAEADRLYARAAAGVGLLPLRCRVGIDVARRLYAAIGHEVGRRGGNSVDGRAVVGASRKAALVARAIGAAWPRQDRGEPPLAATRFLVDAAADAAAPLAHPGKVVWLLGLIERLERADRFGASGMTIAR